MTNLEMAASLRALADVYEGNADKRLVHPMLYCYANSKDEAIGLVKAIGGRFVKNMGSDTDPYATITLTSSRIYGLSIALPRDKVCHKTVKWDCEPLLSPEEEAELEEVSGG